MQIVINRGCTTSKGSHTFTFGAGASFNLMVDGVHAPILSEHFQWGVHSVRAVIKTNPYRIEIDLPEELAYSVSFAEVPILKRAEPKISRQVKTKTKQKKSSPPVLLPTNNKAPRRRALAPC